MYYSTSLPYHQLLVSALTCLSRVAWDVLVNMLRQVANIINEATIKRVRGTIVDFNIKRNDCTYQNVII